MSSISYYKSFIYGTYQTPLFVVCTNKQWNRLILEAYWRIDDYFACNKLGYRNILTIKCCFSKYAWLFPLGRKEITEVYNATKFLFEKEGFPEIFQSDNGKEFVGRFLSNFLKSHKVKVN